MVEIKIRRKINGICNNHFFFRVVIDDFYELVINLRIFAH